MPNVDRMSGNAGSMRSMPSADMAIRPVTRAMNSLPSATPFCRAGAEVAAGERVMRSGYGQMLRPSESQYGALSSRFSSLPASLRGISETTSKLRGTL